MITSRQLRAARALAGLDQRALAKASRLSLPTIQRMEASEGVVRGNVEALMKLIAALDRLGIEVISGGALCGAGGRALRVEESGCVVLGGLLWCVAALLGTGVSSLALPRRTAGNVVYGLALVVSLVALIGAGAALLAPESFGGTLTLP